MFEATKEMERWLLDKIHAAKVTLTSNLNADTAFEELGLDSLAGVILSEELADDLKIRIEPTVFWDFPTVGELAKHLVELIQAEQVSHLPQAQLIDAPAE